MDQKFISKSAEETKKIGLDFSKKLRPQDVVFLVGELGSGKTTFTKGVASGLGIATRVTSPTFVVVRIYQTHRDEIQRIYHLDLYRLADENEAKGIDIKDFLADKNAVVLLEWPAISQDIVKGKVWKADFKMLENDTREITITKDENRH